MVPIIPRSGSEATLQLKPMAIHPWGGTYPTPVSSQDGTTIILVYVKKSFLVIEITTAAANPDYISVISTKERLDH